MFSKDKNTKKTKLLWLFGVLATFLMISAIIRNIRKIMLIRGQLESQRKVVEKIEAENAKLQEQILNTQDINFLENEARNKLGLVREGETAVILPDDEILKKLAPTISEDEDIFFEPNWKQWLNLFR